MLTVGLERAAGLDRRRDARRARALRRRAAAVRAHARRAHDATARQLDAAPAPARDRATSACSRRSRACRASCSSPSELRRRAYDDGALPIGHGQTISQPFMVATICAALELGGGRARARRRHRLGLPGGGARRARRRGRHDRARARARRAARARRSRGPATSASRCASATARSACPSARRSTRSRSRPPRRAVPEALYDQLAEGGRLVVPVGSRRGQRLEIVVRGAGRAAVVRSVPCRFVPLVGAAGFDE